MSSTTENSSSADDPTPWGELTTAQQRVAKAVAHVHGPTTFERPDLQNDVRASSTVVNVIDGKDRVLTSLKYTRLLNDLVDDGYLIKEFQGGRNPIILDLGYEEDRDDWEVAPYGATSRLWDIVAQILDRENLREGALGDVDENDFNEIRNAVNAAVGRITLVTVSEASKYRFRQDPYKVAREKAEEFAAEHE